MVRHTHGAGRDPRSVCRQAPAVKRPGGVDLRACAAGLAADRDRDARHSAGARLYDDFIRRGRTLPGSSEHLLRTDYGASHRVRDRRADGTFWPEPERLVCAAVPDRLSPGGVGGSLSVPGAGLSEPARPGIVLLGTGPRAPPISFTHLAMP